MAGTWPTASRGAVPGPAVGVARIRQHGGQGPVRPLALGEPGSPVHGRAHQRVAELDAITSDANQALRLGNRQRARVQPELGRRPGNRGALSRLLAGGDREHAPCLGR